jgi:hypothetical protein
MRNGGCGQARPAPNAATAGRPHFKALFVQVLFAKPVPAFAGHALRLPAFPHVLDQAVWPHIGPILIYEFEASGTAVRFVNYGPAFGDIDEAWPKGMLAFIVYQNMIGTVFVLERICHFVLH